MKEYILEHSVEDEARYTAIRFMSLYYFRKGKEEKAWEYAKRQNEEKCLSDCAGCNNY